MLEREVVPTFYQRDSRGIPIAWLNRVRRSLPTLIPNFSAGRMLDDYLRGPYGAFQHE